MKKTAKRILIGVVCIPAILILVFIGYEIIGMTVNHAATAKQTRELKHSLRDNISNVEIIDEYSETGNTSGTGNHVDMLSIIIFRADSDIAHIEDEVAGLYEKGDAGVWVETLTEAKKRYEGYDSKANCYEYMTPPGDTSGYYVIYEENSAPFEDNIEGH